MAGIDLVELKTAYEALAFKDAIDIDAVFDKFKARREEFAGGKLNAELLRSIFVDLGVDKVIEPPAPEPAADGEDSKDGGEEDGGKDEEAAADAAADEEGGKEGGEDGEAEPAAPPPEPEYTNNAGELFNLLDPAQSGEISASDFLCIVNLIVKGYGEPSLKFSTGAFDLGESGLLGEEELFSAIRWCASGELTPILRTHLRRLWRSLAKDGASGVTRVQIEEFFEKLGEDPFLGEVLLAEKAIELPKPEGAEDGDEEEED